MDSIRNSTSNEKREVDDNNQDVVIQINTDVGIIGGSKDPCRAFHCVRGINVSLGTTQVDPELADSASIADIVHSIEDNNLSKYLSSMNDFTAKFMYKSLQYVRALRFYPHHDGIGPLPAGDAYIDYGQYLRSRYVNEFVAGPSDHNAYEHIAHHSLSEPTDDIRKLYGRLQYMCDYFKYYVLESQFECLPFITKKHEEEYTPLLNAISEERKNEQPINVGFDVEEVSLTAKNISNYEKLIIYVGNECLDIVKRKIPSLRVKDVKSLKIEYLESSNRDTLIKSLMEYYLLITDKFESIADLNFEYRDKFLSEKNVLPVPREVAEVVHEEIETGRPTSNYHASKVDHFFCDDKRCMCLSTNSESRYVTGIDHNMSTFTLSLIRKHVMEEVVNRMKRYIMSLNTESIT
ncbi:MULTISPECIES: hypothetical protein [Candidatus Ichthyocystis]|uniref:Uncharacterized protein n=1 Tax=Candidatus Ichthyocystis hellenicum TaxID=1561003 RepID=A0A0S4M731_9BURK|nr:MULTISPECIES: hypothetical protein [Ichthyocystis]CUT17960.1 hypothetical protein Ark11_1147 [Candidatus Ichthyocystis hellenicum]